MTPVIVYGWIVFAITCVVIAVVVPWKILHDQNQEIERLARVAVCVSLAEQERLHGTDHPLDLRNGCYGLTGAQILAQFQNRGQDIGR